MRPDPGSRRRVRAALLLLFPFLPLAPVPLGAEEDQPATGRLTPALLASGKLLQGLPDWAWRPGRAQLVRVEEEGRRRVLVSLDPASGKRRDLIDLGALDALVPRERMDLIRIGRRASGPVTWEPSGTACCVAVKGDLVWVDLEGDLRRRLTRTTSPLGDVQVAPGGRHVSFSRDDDLWVVATAEGVPRRVSPEEDDDILDGTLDWLYPEELDLEQAAWWAPDGESIAWLRLDQSSVPRVPIPDHLDRHQAVHMMRYPKAGESNPVASVAVSRLDGTTTWLDLGRPPPEYVCRVTWFPDGRRVAVVVLDRAQRLLRLLACPVDGTPPDLLLEEQDPAWVDVPPAPRFVSADRFLWQSHREGFTRWYLAQVPPPGKRASLQALTAPGVDVRREPFFDPPTGRCFYVGSRHGSPRARPFLGGVGRAEVLEEAAFAPRAHLDARVDIDPTGTFAVVRTSDARTPQRLDLRRVEDGDVVRALGDAHTRALRAVALPVAEFGRLDAPQGPVDWVLWGPAGGWEEGRRVPVVVNVYGGPGSSMVRDAWTHATLLAAFLVQEGFAVASLDGRGSAGAGKARERAVVGRLGMLELEDQAYGMEALFEARPWLDRSRVGIFGWSYGGTMVCQALTRRSDLFRVGVAVAPVTDWRLYDTIYTERYMGLPSENPGGYRETAATRRAESMNGQLLLLHGAADDNVHVQNALQMIHALVEADREGFEAMIYPNRGHGLGGAHADVWRRTIEHFRRHLK